MSHAEEYEKIPFRYLEEMGLPLSYIQLSYEQQNFVDYFLDTMVEMSDTIQSLEEDVDKLERKLDIATAEATFDD